jgi:hypothetical protein
MAVEFRRGFKSGEAHRGGTPGEDRGSCPGDTFQEAFRELKVKTKLRFNIDLVPPGPY